MSQFHVTVDGEEIEPFHHSYIRCHCGHKCAITHVDGSNYQAGGRYKCSRVRARGTCPKHGSVIAKLAFKVPAVVAKMCEYCGSEMGGSLCDHCEDISIACDEWVQARAGYKDATAVVKCALKDCGEQLRRLRIADERMNGAAGQYMSPADVESWADGKPTRLHRGTASEEACGD